MGRKFLWLFLFLSIGAAMILGRLRLNEHHQRRTFATFMLREESYQAVIAQTPAEITQGLSDRDTIGADAMLFLLPDSNQPTFWMYHMRFPLDFIWLADGQVVDLHQNVPIPSSQATAAEIPTVRPQVAVTAVLEAPAGFIAKHQITRGDRYELISPWHDQLW